MLDFHVAGRLSNEFIDFLRHRGFTLREFSTLDQVERTSLCQQYVDNVNDEVVHLENFITSLLFR